MNRDFSIFVVSGACFAAFSLLLSFRIEDGWLKLGVGPAIERKEEPVAFWLIAAALIAFDVGLLFVSLTHFYRWCCG
jgi:hypothetical protein